MKTYKNIGFGPRKSKGGFTLIELLIVMVILAILAGVVVMAVGGVFGSAHEAAYNSVHDDVQNAVVAYATDNNGNFPTIVNSSGNYSIDDPQTCANCVLVNISALLTTNGGMLRAVPDGLWDGSEDGSDSNCDDAFMTPAEECLGSYVWVMDTYGNIFSSCQGTDCAASSCGGGGNISGFCDDVWP